MLATTWRAMPICVATRGDEPATVWWVCEDPGCALSAELGQVAPGLTAVSVPAAPETFAALSELLAALGHCPDAEFGAHVVPPAVARACLRLIAESAKGARVTPGSPSAPAGIGAEGVTLGAPAGAGAEEVAPGAPASAGAEEVAPGAPAGAGAEARAGPEASAPASAHTARRAALVALAILAAKPAGTWALTAVKLAAAGWALREGRGFVPLLALALPTFDELGIVSAFLSESAAAASVLVAVTCAVAGILTADD